jgi:hypothetical protein
VAEIRIRRYDRHILGSSRKDGVSRASSTSPFAMSRWGRTPDLKSPKIGLTLGIDHRHRHRQRSDSNSSP